MKRSQRSSRAVAFVAAALAVSACMKQDARTAAPSGGASQPAPPANAREAEEVLRNERRNVETNAPPRSPKNDGAVPKDSGKPALQESPPPPTAPAPPKAAPPRDKPADAEAKKELEHDELAMSPCAVACRAYQSMRRAAEVVCREVGEENERCRAARDAVADARDRVSTCGCRD